MAVILLTSSAMGADPNTIEQVPDPNTMEIPTAQNPVILCWQDKERILTVKMYGGPGAFPKSDVAVEAGDLDHLFGEPVFFWSVYKNWYDGIPGYIKQLRQMYIKGRSLDELKEKLQ